MLKVVIGYPNKETKNALYVLIYLRKVFQSLTPLLSPEDILKARKVVREVYMDEKIEQYIIDIVFATRYPDQYKLGHYKNLITYGASPRASINLALAAKAYAIY
jgi:MoxR-like ATPase